MKIFVSLAFLIASFVAAPTMGFAQENLEELLEELEAELGEDFEELLEDLDPDEIAAIEAALEEALDDADNAAELIDVINAAEGALGDLDGAGAIANEARAIVGGGGGGGGGGAGAGAGAGVVVVARDPTETICMVGEDCDLRGRGETVRDEYGNTICLRGNCDFADPEIVAGVVLNDVRDGIREGLTGGERKVRTEWQAELDKIGEQDDLAGQAKRAVDMADELILNVTGYQTRAEALAAEGMAAAVEWSQVRRGIAKQIGRAYLNDIEETKAEVEALDRDIDRVTARLLNEFRGRSNFRSPR